MNETIRPVLTGRKALVVGIANDQSIAYGCAKAFRTAGADLAVTWLNDKARPHVEPLARELEAAITVPLDVAVAGPARGGVRRDRPALGQARHPGPFHRLRAARGPARRPARLLGRGLRQGDGRLLPFLHPHGPAGGAADDGRRHDVRHELLRRQPRGAELQRHGAGQGRPRSRLPLPRLRARAARHPRARHLARARSRRAPRRG